MPWLLSELHGLKQRIMATAGKETALRYHAMNTFSVLLALYVGNPPVTGGFPPQRVSNSDFPIIFSPKKLLYKQATFVTSL